MPGLVALAALSLLGAAAAPPAAPGQTKPPLRTIRFAKNPAPVPAFTARALDGQTITAADWRGKVVLLNFWATWCPPCREEIPQLIALQKKYAGSLQIVGLSVDDGPEADVKKFARQVGINYPVAVASPELQAKFGSVLGLPTSFLVNRDGGIVQKHVGEFPPAVFETEIRALSGLPVDAKVETFEDAGQVFLPNAERATSLPGVSFAGLAPEQKRAALKELNSTECTCGCKLTLAQCRINDTQCPVSRKTAREVVAAYAGKTAPASTQKK